jgi:hypothetical protein
MKGAMKHVALVLIVVFGSLASYEQEVKRIGAENEQKLSGVLISVLLVFCRVGPLPRFCLSSGPWLRLFPSVSPFSGSNGPCF